MRRRVFSIFAGVSLLLAVGTVGVWGVSYWRVIGAGYRFPPSAAGKMKGLGWGIAAGAMRIAWGSGEPQSAPGWWFSWFPRDHNLFDWTEGLWFHHEWYRGGGFREDLVLIPLWLPTVMCLILPLIWFRRYWRERRQQRAGRCRVCGYDLRAHAPGQLCPECGTVVPADIERKELA